MTGRTGGPAETDATDPTGAVGRDRPRVLVWLAHEENRRLLTGWLSASYAVSTVETPEGLPDEFDLCLVDEPTFARHRDALVESGARVDSAFRPFLLVRSADGSELPPAVRRHVDEVIDAPIRQAELRMRIEGLLDRRRQFVALRRRNELIEALHAATQEMSAVGEPGRVCDIAVNAAQRALDLPLTAVWLADDTGTRLEPAAETAESERVFEGLPTFRADGDSLAWHAFETGETMVFDDLREEVPDEHLFDPETPIRSELVIPLGEFGVLITGATVPRSFGDNDIHGAELLGTATTSALERADREQTLAQRTSQLEFFNSIVRHDVLNGMTVIQSRADLLAEQLPDDHHRQYARTIREWSDDVVAVVERVGSVLETLTGGAVADREPVDLSATLERELEAVRTTYPDVTVETSIPAGVTVLADQLLAEVLGNVVRNAVEHNDPADLALAVTVEEGSEFVTVRIADTGTGIPDDRKESVFRRDETGHAKSTGTGFGLFFVDTMIDEYGGSIHVEDNDPTGAVFVITLRTCDS
ncbi:sensor histidine kinase [Halosimplex halophilum]|uniref:sensor histidine kinase n=1 Tax=Halosimplex halophilum TaxID=2559572 RepID=UPI00107F17F8|nr:GAF domain-containing sensor histidine kinase [Halosimplex halophilum]